MYNKVNASVLVDEIWQEWFEYIHNVPYGETVVINNKYDVTDNKLLAKTLKPLLANFVLMRVLNIVPSQKLKKINTLSDLKAVLLTYDISWQNMLQTAYYDFLAWVSNTFNTYLIIKKNG